MKKSSWDVAGEPVVVWFERGFMADPHLRQAVICSRTGPAQHSIWFLDRGVATRSSVIEGDGLIEQALAPLTARLRGLGWSPATDPMDVSAVMASLRRCFDGTGPT